MASAEQYAAWIVANQDKKGTPQFDAVAKAYKAAKYGVQVAPTSPDAQPAAQAEPSILRSLGKSAGNFVAGAARGAGDIGSTILSVTADPIDGLLDGSRSGKESRDAERRRMMDAGLRTMGADTESVPFQVGKVGAQVAGTLGAGGAAGNLLLKVAPRAVPLATALSTGGMGATGANLLTRTVGGATSGALSAGAVNPNDMGAGAVIGGAIPVGGALVSKMAKGGGNLLADLVGGIGTHTGGESIRQAVSAGAKGGKAGKAFVENMRGNADMADVLGQAKAGLSAMRAAKSAEYRAGMAGVSADKSVLAFDGVDDAITKAAGVTSFKGQVKSEAAENVRQKIAAVVDEWKSLDPAEYHTPEGFDALKQRVGAILESVPIEERTAMMVGRDIYKAIGNEITKQAPTYAKVMSAYSKASDDIFEIERALSLGNKSSADTAMRKLQSLTRNNVSTNYGNRLSLMNMLEAQGGQEIMPALAGQSLSSWTPRGLGSAVAGGAGAAGYMSGSMGAAIPVMAAQSPRLVGETAYKLGQASRPVNALMSRIAPNAYRAAPVVIAPRTGKKKEK